MLSFQRLAVYQRSLQFWRSRPNWSRSYPEGNAKRADQLQPRYARGIELLEAVVAMPSSRNVNDKGGAQVQGAVSDGVNDHDTITTTSAKTDPYGSFFEDPLKPARTRQLR
jgi:hypothetical protein